MVIDPVKKHGTYAREIHAARKEIGLSEGFPFACQGRCCWPGTGAGLFVPAAGHDLDGVGQRLCSIAWLALRRAASGCCFLSFILCSLTVRSTGARLRLERGSFSPASAEHGPAFQGGRARAVQIAPGAAEREP
jgi:hypothetical protein